MFNCGMKFFQPIFKESLENELQQTDLKKIEDTLIEIRWEQYKLAGRLVPIEEVGGAIGNEIEDYWTNHTVLDHWFLTAKDSIEYCDRRFSLYPYFREYAEMDREHDNEIILDYGCGPGNDLVWFSSQNKLRKIIGMDVSRTALRNAQYRLALMGVDSLNAKLVHINDQKSELPLEDGSIDFINCQGVLMHTSSPQAILKEFHRVLKPKEGKVSASIMVYNKESIWWHLYVAYYLRFIDNSLFRELPDNIKENMSMEEMFRRSTDGIMCAKAECYTPDEFSEMCKKAGFSKVVYKGGYPNTLEPDIAKKYIESALKEPRLEEEHKRFLKAVEFDHEGYPMYEGKHCCIGGVYLLYS